MSPQVTAAIIAASVSFLTLIGTLVAQIVGRRATSKQLDRTFTEQRRQTLNERFGTAAGQLGSDKPPAVRLAGVYAMAGLADDWPENRQTCVDVLCAYMRLPYDPDPGDGAAPTEQAAYRADREVRHTAIRVIGAHLKDGAAVSWQGLKLDFTGAVFDGGDFSRATFSKGSVNFYGAVFSGVNFTQATFSGSWVNLSDARFSGGKIYFTFAKFSGSVIEFTGAQFTSGTVYFDDAEFSGGEVYFYNAGFSGGEVSFADADFSGGQVYFDGAKFSGGTVDFTKAQFSGGKVDFSNPGDWSCPPAFPWTGTPPPGVVLPEEEDQSQA